MTELILYDDARARDFEPFALTRPLCELRAGAVLVRERWEIALGTRPTAFIGAEHLRDFEEPEALRAFGEDELPAGTIVANARALPTLEGARDSKADAWTVNGRLAAVRLARATAVATLRDSAAAIDSLVSSATRNAEIPGRWLDAPWDLVRHLSQMLMEDIPRIGPTLQTMNPTHASVLRGHPVYAELGSTVEPYVILDATHGPILVRRGAHVHAFSRIVGPCVIGQDSSALGGRIATSSIGNVCRVHGEVSTSIFVGHANKAHDGFIGHCVLGRWVNLGASTVNSNLKNTYGTVNMWTPNGSQDSGLQFLGTLLGDHAKTGIGTRLTTGSVIGAGANVVYDGLAPKVVAPFSWGPGEQLYELERFLQVVERVMARRGVSLGEGTRRQLAEAHAKRWVGAA